jgi:hypothetical protein
VAIGVARQGDLLMLQFLDFVSLYAVVLLWTLLVLPRKISNQILEILFPVLRRL